MDDVLSWLPSGLNHQPEKSGWCPHDLGLIPPGFIILLFLNMYFFLKTMNSSFLMVKEMGWITWNHHSCWLNHPTCPLFWGVSSLFPFRLLQRCRKCPSEAWAALVLLDIPSGELTVCYGKIHHFKWENPPFLWPFSIAMLVHQRVFPIFSYFFWVLYYLYHRIGWWENLQESPIFDGKNPWVSCKFSLKPIQWL